MKKIVNAFVCANKEDKIFLADVIFDVKIKDIIFHSDFSAEPSELISVMNNLKKKHILSEFLDEFDANYNLLIPGAVDPHVHFDEPGFEFREDFYTGTLSAAFGGITTVIDMPCTSIPPVTNVKNLKTKLKAIQKNAVIDFALWGGISGTSFANKEDIEKNMSELAEMGVIGFKTYLISEMEKFTALNIEQLKTVGRIAKKLGLPVAVHSEDRGLIEKRRKYFQSRSKNDIESYCKTRDDMAELVAINSVIKVAKETGAQFHIVHISSKRGLEAVEKAQKEGIKISAEICPHFLAFTQDDFKKIGSILKTVPPVKKQKDREYLWKGLQKGSINFVATDHAGCIPEKEKNTGSIWTDYGGIPGCELMVTFLFSEGYLKNRISLKKTIDLLSINAAEFYGLYPKKGSLEIGTDADFAIINLTEKQEIKGENLHCKGKYTPFEGKTFSAKIGKTFCRGMLIMDEGKFHGKKGFGFYLE
ncbi:MAG: allantoinase AllB [Candidatus Cloacimonetes bacterium]|nr:allantoinase AllB [Candidatus Cloacimonadota bacterium]MBL7085840.1 allantoinase AllB [Candidatus Cloacimonadota bacterium]